ncbi:MAG: PIN domain-containing protein [Actinomycetota bacterium]
MALILDTGIFLAAAVRNERQYAACRELLETATEQLVTPSPVLTEVDYLLRQRVGTGAMLAVIGSILAGGLIVEDLTADDYERVAELMDRYDQIGFVDASVLAICERLEEPKLATLDRRHFGMVRPRHVDALELLP